MKLERVKRKNGGDLILEITPLIDVVFLLLIFFMLATTFETNTAFKIELPKTALKKNVDMVREIQVLIDKDKNMYINYKENLKSKNEKIDMSNFVESISDKLATSLKKEVVISADKSIDYGYVVEVMGLIKKAGANTINIDTAIKR